MRVLFNIYNRNYTLSEVWKYMHTITIFNYVYHRTPIAEIGTKQHEQNIHESSNTKR